MALAVGVCQTVGGAVAESGRRMEHSVPQTAYHVDGVDTKDLLTLDAGGTYTVKADMDKAAGNIGNGNYVLDGVIDGTMTITQASLTVKAGSVEKTYGDTSFQFTKGADGVRKDGISFEGFRNGDAEKLSGLYETRMDSSIDNETANAGTYSSGTHAFIDENDKALLKNYKVTEQDGTAVIGRKDLTVTAGDARKTYGDSAFAYGDVSLAGFSNGDEAKLSGYYRTVADSTIDIPATAVGTYRGMTHAVLEDKYNGLFSNYDVKRVDGTSVVEKAHLTVTAGTGMKSLGRDNSTFEFGPVTFTGFRNDDEKTLGGETGAGHFVTGLAPDAGIETDTPIGTYDGATVAKAAAPLGDYSNYDIGYMPGKVVIDEKKAETIVKENPSYTNIIGGITGGGSIPAIGGGEVPDGLVDIPSFEGNPANGGKDGGHETTSEPSESGANPGAKNGGQPSGNTTGAGSQGGQPIDSALQGSGNKAAEGANTLNTSGQTDKQEAKHEVADGGYRYHDGLDSMRFLTLEDTIIHMSDVLANPGRLIIDKSSRVDGGKTFAIDQEGLTFSIRGTRPLLKGTTVDTAKADVVLKSGKSK